MGTTILYLRSVGVLTNVQLHMSDYKPTVWYESSSSQSHQVLRKPDAIALTEAFSRRGGAAPSLRSGGQASAGGAPAAPAAASAAASVGQVCAAHRLPPIQ